ncbi:hypothetical protein DLAC_03430 [Tieghemostelium lacteum]|uniref:COPI associated protein n=1 Tax=Tieghemostelium lacteum TaxID=361077 RepID=A0A152A2C4_TIELA|nr:hypothetical protein DLAC_03430 [Tieghemostelium lacteum]|eukprot:KYR00267.1 hypothetical protein DLAC_03430 [Tieghemostelium lacteum]
MANQHRVSLAFVILSILVGALMLATGIYIFASSFWRSITSFVIGCYYILFGVFIILFEIIHIPQVQKFIAFYYYWIGKGLLFIFFGFLILQDHGFFLFVGIVILVVGVLLCVMHFILPAPTALIVRERHSSDYGQKHSHTTTTTTQSQHNSNP